jgi:hypothetical protein
MDEARTVIDRLDRIDALERQGAPAAALLDELRELVRDAEAWARRERDERAAEAVARCEGALGVVPAA